MRSLVLGTSLLFALLAASFCGALMACMDSITHHGILANADPVPLMVVAASFILSVISLTIIAPVRPLLTPLSNVDRNRGPDLSAWHILQSAFSDGIVQPKVF